MIGFIKNFFSKKKQVNVTDNNLHAGGEPPFSSQTSDAVVAESTSSIANIDNAESFVMADAMSSVVSNFRDCFGFGYNKDANRMYAPDDLNLPRLRTNRAVGMDACNNICIKSMQAQTFVSYFSKVAFTKTTFIEPFLPADDGAFMDSSYILQSQDENYILKIQALSVARNILSPSRGEYIDYNNQEKSKEQVDSEVKTRNFKEVASSYSKVEIVFKPCNAKDFLEFIANNSTQEQLFAFIKSNIALEQLLEFIKSSNTQEQSLEFINSDTVREQLLEFIKSSNTQEQSLEFINSDIVREQLLEFIANNSKEQFITFVKSNGLQILNIDAVENTYYIPEIKSANYKAYIAPILEEYKAAYIENFQDVYDGKGGSVDINQTDMELTDNPLDIRLEFIAGSLNDAMNVPNLSAEDKNKHIKYALLNIKELVDNKHMPKRDIVNHKLMGIFNEKELSNENKDLLMSFCDDAKLKSIASNLARDIKKPNLEVWQKDAYIENVLKDVSSIIYDDHFRLIEEVVSSESFALIKEAMFEQQLNKSNEYSLSLMCNDYLGEKLEFIAKSLGQGTDQDIKYVLGKIKELVDSENITKQELIGHPKFKEIITNLSRKNLNIENQLLVAKFFSYGCQSYTFGKVVRNSSEAQDLFLELITNSKSEIIANQVAGLNLKLREKVINAVEDIKEVRSDFCDINGGTYYIQKAEEQSKKFEAREQTTITFGVIATACLIGSGYGLGMAMLVGFGIGIFVLCTYKAYSFNSEKTMNKCLMETINRHTSATKSEFFESSYRADVRQRTNSKHIDARPEAVKVLQKKLLEELTSKVPVLH